MDSYEEIRAKNFKFGQVGDYLKGTLTSVSKTQKPDAYGKLSHIYTVRASEGEFLGSTKNEKTGKYVQDAAVTKVNPGEDYTFFISNDRGVVIANMKDIKNGQKFMIKFTETKPTDKGNDAKILKVYAGKDSKGAPLMDQEYLDSIGDDKEKEYEEMA